MEHTINSLKTLDQLTNTTNIVLYASLDDAAKEVLYDTLLQIGFTEKLNLVVFTHGGPINTARHIALLLRRFTNHLILVVPEKARSAGTILALAANEIVMTPFSELSPIDPLLQADRESPTDEFSQRLSTQDIQTFYQLAKDWFKVEDNHNLNILSLLTQHFSPGALVTFYRSDSLIRQIGLEMLQYQLPDSPQKHNEIIDKLVNNYHSHFYIIDQKEATELGLNVREASLQEMHLFRELHHEIKQFLLTSVRAEHQRVRGLIGWGNTIHLID